MITLNAISHSLAGKSLFTDLSLSLLQKRYGLVGPNGIGKTTLAKIIAGSITPSSGHVAASCPVRYLAQFEQAENMTLSEYLFDIWEMAGFHAELIDKLLHGLDLDRALSQLSGGEWMRARLARLLAMGPAFLALDEPSNNLDRQGREIIKDFIRNYSDGLLLISHDRELLEEVNSVIELSNQGASIYGGNFSFYWQTRYKERKVHEEKLAELKRLAKKTERESQAKRERQEKRMSHGEKRVERLGISRTQAGAMKRAAQTTMGSICKDTKERICESTIQVKESWSIMKLDPFIRLDFECAEVPAGKTLLSIKELNWQFAGSESCLWAEPLDFHIQGMERWQILGKNGSGKSTLAKLVVNQRLIGDGTISGDLRVGTTAIAYLDQKYGLLDPEISLLKQLQRATRYNAVELRNELAFYGFTGQSVFQKVKTLSGGELLKASLAHIFLGEKIPELLILDEPTNNLDLLSIELLERAVSAFCGSLIVISHDQEFVNQLGIEHSLNLDY